jgi:hypothetical protein
MAIKNRIASLQKRHTEIDDEILMEESRPAPDVAHIHQLKREKLSLKDELARLMEQVEAA